MNINKIKKWLWTRFQNRKFKDSAAYWENRYATGGNSGAGSYDKLAIFKADVINAFIKEHKIASVIEFGCGDGNQLALGEYPKYIGLDVAKTSIGICSEKFRNDPNKSFFIYNSQAFVDRFQVFKADLTLSLDVIYHMIEDNVFSNYMSHVFNAARLYVVIYSTDFDSEQTFHVRHRNFTKWIQNNIQGWQLVKRIKNNHSFDALNSYSSSADFFIYERTEI